MHGAPHTGSADTSRGRRAAQGRSAAALMTPRRDPVVDSLEDLSLPHLSLPLLTPDTNFPVNPDK